jgi:hypothetical protein
MRGTKTIMVLFFENRKEIFHKNIKLLNIVLVMMNRIEDLILESKLLTCCPYESLIKLWLSSQEKSSKMCQMKGDSWDAISTRRQKNQNAH